MSTKDNNANDSRDFSKYIVIFVDVLGSKGRNGFDEQYRVSSIFHDTFEDNKNAAPSYVIHQRKVYTFSDCAYIFYNYKDGIADERKDIRKLLTVALCNCEPIFLKLLSQRIVFRGGIAYGDAYVDSDRAMFFGEAVTRAYTMESSLAIHPRILVDDFIAETLNKYIIEVNEQLLIERQYGAYFIAAGLLPLDPDTGYGIIEQDTDGKYIYNYLHQPEYNMCIDGKTLIKNTLLFCEEQIKQNDDLRVIDKYYYLKRFCESKLS